jgi:hypothetical protein
MSPQSRLIPLVRSRLDKYITKKAKKKKKKGSYFVGVIQPPACGKIEIAYTTSKDLRVAQSLPFGQAEPPLCRWSRGKAAAGHPKGFSSFLFYWFFKFCYNCLA